jgi:hypothetical protein
MVTTLNRLTLSSVRLGAFKKFLLTKLRYETQNVPAFFIA